MLELRTVKMIISKQQGSITSQASAADGSISKVEYTFGYRKCEEFRCTVLPSKVRNL